MERKHEEYFLINKQSWNKRLEIHKNSKFYDNPGFIAGRNSLNTIELDLLSDVKDKRVLHLQCHFGQDSISLARMGAHVTAVDISDKSIDFARKLAVDCKVQIEFVCENVLNYDTSEEFDIIFTSYGTIIWLNDLKSWASVINKHLKKGGSFVMADFHPFIMMFDDNMKYIKYDYFNKGAIEEMESGSYTDGSKQEELKSITWNHSLSDVLMSLLDTGMEIKQFREYDYSPYNCFEGMEEIEQGKFIFNHLKNRPPMVFGLKAVK